MLFTELFEQDAIIPHGHYTLRSDADTPGALRLINTDTRELVGLVRSPADFLRLANPRTLRGADIEIKVPGAVYQANAQIVQAIERMLPIVQRQQGRPFRMINLSQPVQEVTAQEVERPHLYLDMDGVQADFFSAWARWHGQHTGQGGMERYKDIGSREQREQSITELSAQGPEFVERFFATLPTLPGGQRLIRWLRQNRIPFTVLSAPLRGMEQSSIAGKRTWLDRHNPGTTDSAIFTGDKARMATRGGRANVLVDDFKQYVNAWREAGGIGLLYRDSNVDEVIRELSEIYGVGVREAQDFQTHGARLKTYVATLRIRQGATYQRMDTTVVARSPEQAKRLLEQQFGQGVVVGRPREMR